MNPYKKINLQKILPVLMSFIVMGFVDIVGVSVGYAKKDFSLADDIAQLIPAMAFLWFFLLSIPVGVLLDRYGKKNILNLGMGITGLGMVIPFIHYSFPVMLFAFVLLGIGNTIVQVSANPLLHDAVPKEKFSSFMSLSQFIKAICSLLGPIIATFMAAKFGNWKLVFAVYAITSIVAVLWLQVTKIEEYKVGEKHATMKSCFALLKNKYIALMVLAIFLIVGADVGMNANIANFLSTKFDLSLENASLGISVYFTALMIGRFLGAVLLNWISARKFLVVTVLIAIASTVFMVLAPSSQLAFITIFIIGLGAANLFPLVFSITVEKFPDRTNEISGLMITAVAGGAVIPPIIGVISKNFGVTASMMVILVCFIYVIGTAIYALKKD